jgi:hypothetical protein
MHGPAIMIFSIGKSTKRTRPYSGNGGGMQIFEKPTNQIGAWFIPAAYWGSWGTIFPNLTIARFG